LLVYLAQIPREDVAATLLEVAQLPKGQADGLMLDLLSGDNDIPSSVRDAAERGRTDFEG
jgi:hypothetical protein